MDVNWLQICLPGNMHHARLHFKLDFQRCLKEPLNKAISLIMSLYIEPTDILLESYSLLRKAWNGSSVHSNTFIQLKTSNVFPRTLQPVPPGLVFHLNILCSLWSNRKTNTECSSSLSLLFRHFPLPISFIIWFLGFCTCRESARTNMREIPVRMAFWNVSRLHTHKIFLLKNERIWIGTFLLPPSIRELSAAIRFPRKVAMRRFLPPLYHGKKTFNGKH